MRSVLAAVILAVTLVAAPASAQQAQAPAAQEETELVGLPLYSADGERLGEITQVGMHGEHKAVQAEIGGFLAMGPKTVIIPLVALEQKADRVELGMTAAEVKDMLSRNQKQ
jgi:ribosomal 30S subunit maturation factor RimM